MNARMPCVIRYRDLFAGQGEEMTASLLTKLTRKVQGTMPDRDKHNASDTQAECCTEQPHLQKVCEEGKNLAHMKGEAVPVMRDWVKGWMRRQRKQSDR